MNNNSMKIHHIGYLVKNIEKSIGILEKIGFVIDSAIYFDKDRNADICFISGNGLLLELVSPKIDSDLYPLLKTYSNQPYHLCYEVSDIENTIAELKKQGFLLFKEKQDALAISNTAQVVFLMHRHIGMIELVQK